MAEQLKFSFMLDRVTLPDYVVREIEQMGRAGWKAYAISQQLQVSENVVYKYLRSFGIKRRAYKYQKKK